MSNPNNPLKKYFRQPKLYIKLPSSGNFYPDGSLEKTETNEYPIYAMTAKDDIIMKTPDALLNGQATVDLIQSCVPNIKNAWHVPNIDIDALLIAIRIASSGPDIDIEVTLPNTNITKTYTTDLRYILDQLLQATFDPIVKINDSMTIEIKPLTYMEFTKNSIKTLEEQRVFGLLNDDNMSNEQKLDIFSQSLRKLTEITVSMVNQCIAKIKVDDIVVTEPEYIQEFIENADKDFFKKIIKHLEDQRDKFQMKPFTVQTTNEEQELGAPASFEAPITLDTSNFFV